jgi:hypothetical protein
MTLDVLGFAEDGKQMLVRTESTETAPTIRLYDIKLGQVQEAARPASRPRPEAVDPATEARTVRRFKRRYRIKQDAVEDLRTEDKKLAFFGVLKDEELVLAATDYKKLGKVAGIPRARDAQTGEIAESTLKRMYWTPDRKIVAAVITQRFAKLSIERDELHVLKFLASEIRWVKTEADKKKEEEEEDDGWWIF